MLAAGVLAAFFTVGKDAVAELPNAIDIWTAMVRVRHQTSSRLSVSVAGWSQWLLMRPDVASGLCECVGIICSLSS